MSRNQPSEPPPLRLDQRRSCENRRFSDYDPADLCVQVKIGPHSPWHRRAIAGRATACGKPIADPTKSLPEGYDLRQESYRGPACTDGCFSSYELACFADASR